MNESTKHIVREIYCEVLFELAEEAGKVDAVMDDLDFVEKVLREEPEFTAIMTSPTITGEEKAKAARRVFSGKIGDLALDFISVLAKRNRIKNLFDITLKFESLIDKHYKRYPISVKLSHSPDPEQIENLKSRISEAIDGQVKLSIEVDPSIIGGVILEKDGKVIDNSVATRLKSAVESIKENSRQKSKR